MPDFNFNATREQAAKEHGLDKGGYFKVSEGANRIRLVSECLSHPGTYKGKRTFKWLCQIIDRKDGQLKPYFMPDTVYKMIADLQLNPDYAFTSVPMPYDITINATNAGTKEVDYSVFPARENTPLTTEEQNMITAEVSVKELQTKIRESEKDEVPEPPVARVNEDGYIETQPANTEDINVDDIPF